MSILTNDEINELSHPAARGKSVNACIMAAEKLILQKLAGMELPEPCYAINEAGEKVPYFTADQLHQAYAQGAASQLSAEPVAYMDIHGYLYDKSKFVSVYKWMPLYTLKDAK